MKKFSLVACLVVLAASLSPDTRALSAQRQMNQDRTPQGQSGNDRMSQERNAQNQRGGESRRPADQRANPDDEFQRRGRGKDTPSLDDVRQRRRNRRALRDPGERRKMQQQIMRAIGLRPEQVTRMSEIRRSFDDEIIASGRRIRETRRALDRAIMSERFDQELFDRYAEEHAKAQADNVRLQARIRAQIRGVLTPEQVIRFNELERKLRREKRSEKFSDQ
ncbi:MAG TPA: Spy/CpxP family protein refolding chaperone [Blastocatellia bacterium]|nr:Spy/CpxP family protein refolding chaperone [Blastocatellia bacterium]